MALLSSSTPRYNSNRTKTMTKNSYLGAVALASLLVLSSCTDHNRPDEPTARVQTDMSTTATHTIAQLKALYSGGATTISENVVVEATMASDDTEGNLYRTAYIQDATGGIELKLSLGNLSTIYPQGSKVLLFAKGMTLGRYGGQINLGYVSQNERYETSFYPEKLVGDVLRFRSTGSAIAQTTTIAGLSTAMQGQLIRLEGVQFRDSDLGQTFAAPDNRDTQGYVERSLVDRTGKSVVVRTSSYAKFAGRQLPTGSGSVTAILTYFNTTPQLVLLRERDAQLTEARF